MSPLSSDLELAIKNGNPLALKEFEEAYAITDVTGNWKDYVGWTKDEVLTLETSLMTAIQEKINENSTIVMLGCNHGNIARIVADKFARYKAKITAVDKCTDALKKGILAEEQINSREPINYLYNDVCLMGFNPQYQNMADIVTLNFLPSNVPKQNQDLLFKSAANILKPKGKLIFVDPDPNAIYDAACKEMPLPQTDSVDTFRVICDQFGNPLKNCKEITKDSTVRIYLLEEQGNVIIVNDRRPMELYLRAINEAGLKIDSLQRLNLAGNKSEKETYFCCLCSKR